MHQLTKLGTVMAKARSLDVFNVIEDIQLLDRTKTNIPGMSISSAGCVFEQSCSADIEIFKGYTKPSKDYDLNRLIMQRRKLLENRRGQSSCDILGKKST